MSYQEFIVIPADPRLVPTSTQRQALRSSLERHFPGLEIKEAVSAGIEFHTAMENFCGPNCGRCRQELDGDFWQPVASQEIKSGYPFTPHPCPL